MNPEIRIHPAPLSALPLDEQLSYSLRRSYVDAFQKEIFEFTPLTSFVLDLGGVRHNTRGFFRLDDYPIRRLVLNLHYSTGADVIGDATEIPFGAQIFDCIICAEILEHVFRPAAVLQQVNRMLKPGGSIVITVPFLFRKHSDPLDYGRYTDDYWNKQLAEAGFGEIRIVKQGLFLSVAVDMFRDWSRHILVEQKINYRFGIWLLPRLIRWARQKAMEFDLRIENQSHAFWGQYTTGFGIQAKKLTT